MFNWCYHGSVDETVAIIGEDGETAPKPGNVGPQVDPAETTVVVEFNDLEGVRRALARRDIACVLTEPALTNIGIVLPEPGFLEGLEQACRETGTLLVYDETHTISAGPGGCVAAWGLTPDIVTIGKSLGAGVPVGGLRRVAGGARADRGRRRGRLPGLGRRRRHARGQRAVAGRHARHARRGADRRGVRRA